MPQIDFNAMRGTGPQGVLQGLQYGQELQNKLAQEEQQRQLGQIQLQNALREQKAAEEESAAWKTGANDPQKILQELQNRGLGKQAMALQKQLLETQASKLKQQKDTVDLVKHTANQIFANPENAVSILSSFNKQTGVDVSDDIAQIQNLGGNIDAIKKWALGHAVEADKLLPKFQQINAGGSTIVGSVNPLDARFTPVSELQHTMTPSEAANVGLRSQEVGLRGREVKLREEEAMLRREGIEGIAPKELQKREAAFPQATSAIKGIESKSENFIKDLIALRNHPGLDEITGLVAGRIPGLSDKGRAAQALYDKITAKGGFQALQDLRDASKTGGALGTVSDKEGKQLIASFAAIDRRQNAADVRAAIDQAIGDVEGTRTRMREAYDTTYSYRVNKPQTAAPSASQRSVAKTGTYNGRKVIQYTDGSIEYAD